jgi:hypothetical protein
VISRTRLLGPLSAARGKKFERARLVRPALSKVLLHQRDDLEEILTSRYGSWLPDDDTGREDLELLLHHHKFDLALPMERRKVAHAILAG